MPRPLFARLSLVLKATTAVHLSPPTGYQATAFTTRLSAVVAPLTVQLELWSVSAATGKPYARIRTEPVIKTLTDTSYQDYTWLVDD